MSINYNDTVRLPKTDFPMRAGLAVREPELLKGFTEARRYEKLMEKNEGRPLYILHDGPPFSNGDIHSGTGMNKVLKDFIIRYKNMAGFKAPYVPGWDNHGLPIESQVAKKAGVNRRNMSVADFRSACQDYAMEYVDRQRAQFVRLGVLGDWEHPYLTMDKSFEAEEIRVFGRMFERGYIYRGLKPVYWCAHDETALAEAEIEYKDTPCDSIYVGFALSGGEPLVDGVRNEDISVVIWTTTTWTLPGNVAISLHPRFSYGVYRVGTKCFLIAEERFDTIATVCGWEGAEKIALFSGEELEGRMTKHPFLNRESKLICGTHVTLEAGTGCVHTAPGHGLDDYYACMPHELPIVVPVDATGHMTPEAGFSAGLTYEQANEAILEHLKASGALVATERVEHSYPHCWRCRKPVIYRATEQWFASVDQMKDKALRAVEDINWLPEWGRERMLAMVRERADWCISRQRQWGLPIPAFFCGTCHKEVITPESIESVAAMFAKEGSNAWFARPAHELLPEGVVCPHCGGATFEKETDTLDGWFDSGSSHVAVLKLRPELRWPADLYLEGGDQFRGWFQSSLLTAMATEGEAPYRMVSAHGWTVDGEGKKMSKSLGNTILPSDIVDKFGADIFRLWVSSLDYHSDNRISLDLMKQLSEIYMKIRNTARFILGNLSDFDPNAPVPSDALCRLDRFILHRTGELIERVRASYDALEYHTTFHALHNFCVLDLSNFYLDIVKDRLYCDGGVSASRRGAQTVMYRVLDALTRLLAPILAFTSEEIWQAMPHADGVDAESVLFNAMPEAEDYFWMSESADEYRRLVVWRERVNAALELARADKVIGKSLQAHVTLTADGDEYALLNEHEAALSGLFIVSGVTLEKGAENVAVAAAGGEKCPRCWCVSAEHPSAEHPELCPRCAQVVSAL